MTENVDQAVVDEILASAEADTPEGRLEKLEKEIELLKGSIKRLLLDIRETMNNLENPFQNLQGLAESGIAQQPQPIQIIPTPIPEVKEEKEEERAEEEKEEKREIEEESREVERQVAADESVTSEGIEIQKEVVPEEGGSMQQVVVEDVEGKAVKERKLDVQVLGTVKYDILTLFDLMEWVKGMLEKYDINSLKTMLEVFEVAGYISSEAKEFVGKVADLMAANDGFEDMLLELYRLHKIMHPSDTSMDSKLLSLILEKRL